MKQPSEVDIQKAEKLQKWKCVHYTLIAFALFGASLVLMAWNVVLCAKDDTYSSSSVSAVLAYPPLLPFTLICNIIGIAMLATVVMARNIQVHVHFARNEFSVCWRNLNFASNIMSYIGYFGLIMMTIFDVTNFPFVHIIWAGVLIFGMGFYEIFHAILTIRYRQFQYRKQGCKEALYFVDGILCLLLSFGGVIFQITYVVLYQTTGQDITGSQGGISQDYYVFQWVSIWCILGYSYVIAWIEYWDSSDDEMQLFFQYSYFYITKGQCNPRYEIPIEQASSKSDQIHEI